MFLFWIFTVVLSSSCKGQRKKMRKPRKKKRSCLLLEISLTLVLSKDGMFVVSLLKSSLLIHITIKFALLEFRLLIKSNFS